MTPVAGEIALAILVSLLIIGACTMIGCLIAYWLSKPTSYRDLEP